MSMRPVLVSLASLATIALASSVSSAASADECTGWFCDDDPAPSEGGTTPDAKESAPAEGGTVTLPGAAVPGIPSEVLSGTITEVVPGDHLTLKLPSGELKTQKWSELLQLQVSGKIVIGAGAAAPPAAPSPPPATVVISPPPPKYLPPPPPAPSYAPPPADASVYEPPSRHGDFKPRWTLGLGLSLMSPSDRATFVQHGPPMRKYVGGGTGFEASLGYRISPAWTTYGFYEYGRFRTTADNGPTDSSTTSSLLGMGLRANTNPDGPLGFFFDLGFGYRWLTVPTLQGRETTNVEYSGWDYLRLGAGLSLNSSRHVRWHLAVVGSAGSFSKMKNASGCDSCDIPAESRGSYGFAGATFGGQFDL
jgi:hypothetical protein